MWAELGLRGLSRPIRRRSRASGWRRSSPAGRGVPDAAAATFGVIPASTTARPLSRRPTCARLDLQRLLRASPAPASRPLADPIRSLAEYELHRRKSFWVDEALAYMLANTDLDVCGRSSACPSLASRSSSPTGMCCRWPSGCSPGSAVPFAGYLLRVSPSTSPRTRWRHPHLALGLAPDALGADPPLARHDVPLSDDVQLAAHLDELAPALIADPPVPTPTRCAS